MPFSPVVSGTGLAENEVVRPENLAIRTGPQAVHGPGLQVHQNSTRHKSPTTRFIVVHVDPLELKFRVTAVAAGGIDAVLGANHFPELGTDLVPTLASLDVKNFPHFWKSRERIRKLGFEKF